MTQAAPEPVAAAIASGSGEEDLLEFLYLMPVGVLRFDDSGTIDLANPVATRLLMPLQRTPDLDNAYLALERLCPDLEERIRRSSRPVGILLDQQRLEAPDGQRVIALTLTVVRIRPGVNMAVLREVGRLSDMAAYAFAGADLLVETSLAGRITWAGGAFSNLFGIAPEHAVGRSFGSLFQADDAPALARATEMVTREGRLRPILIGLDTTPPTRCSLAGMLASAPHRRCLWTIGPVPAELARDEPTPAPRDQFRAAAEEAIRRDDGSSLGVLDVTGWSEATAELGAGKVVQLRRRIAKLGAEQGGSVVLGELAAGRFGIVGQPGTDLARLGTLLEELVRDETGADAHVEGRTVALESKGMTIEQSVQALRLLLTRYAGSGVRSGDGLAGGLAGILERARSNRRSLLEVIRSRAFDLVYQPVVGLQDGRPHHLEALIRPRSDGASLTADPGEFVSLAETVGLARELDQAVLERALGTLKHAPVPVAVNLSALSLADPMFLRRLLEQATRLPRGRLLIEMTETGEVGDLKGMQARLAQLRNVGVPVCIDDFGAGHASFRSVRDIRFDFVKIDGAYVQAAGESEQGRAFIRAMCDLARSSGAETIAEMIETEAEARLMRELGVVYGQGWLFGRPAPLPG